MTLVAGTRLGPYEVIGPLGAGGMGEVYRARDERLDRDVAIKVLPERFAEDPSALSRFEREAKALAALSHPNVLGILDFGKHDGVVYAVTELLEGETLRARLSRSAPSWREAVDVGVAIAEGLAAAHSRGIVHRDLKPENVFLTSDGRVKVLDFGLARRDPISGPEDRSGLATATQHTEPGTVMGTAGYMSPEQVSGQAGDARSDIFSMGCVLYEMVAGTRAFSGGTGAETLAAILRDDPADLNRSKRELPPDLPRIISHCLAKQPEQRVQSARDLCFDLKAILAGSAVSAPAPATRRRAFVWLIPAGTLLLAALVGIVIVIRQRSSMHAGGAIQTLAVLPLENLSHDPEQEYFAEGMTDELITQLAQIGALKVISRTSVMQYKTAKKPLPQIAKDLGVDGVIEGSVMRSGQRVRIVAQLTQASTGKIFWAKSYERDLKDVLALQGEAARAIAKEIQIKLTPQEEQRLTGARPVNPDAYQAYLKGRYYWYRFTAEDYQKSLESFQEAIDKDPSYAAAYAGMADTFVSMTWEGYLSPKEGAEKADRALRKALEIDPALPEAHRVLGGLAWGRDWDWIKAEKEWRKAVDLAPRDAPTRRFFANLLRSMGRWEESIAEMRRAQELDPLGIETNKALGATYYWARQYDRAVEQFKKTLELDPNHVQVHELLADVYARQERFKDAIAQEQRALILSGDQEGAAALGNDFEASGYRKAMEVIYRRNLGVLKEASKEAYVSPVNFAVTYASLGDKDEAFRWLAKAYAESAPWLVLLRDPEFDGIRSDPRFADLMRRVGIPGA